MNTSNVNAIANSNLAGEIDTRRGHAMRSYFKRQSRRQVRHRLATELRMQMEHHLAEATEMKPMLASEVHRNPVMASTATIIAFPNREQRDARSVLVVRKSARDPFARQQVRFELLAA
jgi:hypothetical protein